MSNLTISGTPHDVVVLRVIAKDDFGRPLSATFVYGGMVDLTDGLPNEFITAFVPTTVITPQTRGRA